MPDKFGKEALDAHNRFRSLHQTPPLKWSRALEKDAESWAKQLAKEGQLRQGETDDGESIYAVTGKSDVFGGEVVDRWYAEVDKYDFRNPGFKSGTGHFTQIVWQETNEMGMAKVKDSKGKIIVVARYSPPGNVINHFQENVKPKLGSSESYSSRNGDSRDTSPRFEQRRDPFNRDNDERRPSPFRQQSDHETRREFFERGEGRGQQPRRQETTQRVCLFADPFKDINDSWGERKAKPTSYSTPWSSQKPKESKPEEKFTPSSSATSSPNGSFAKQSLDTHNKFRSMHGVPPLKWADDLAEEAQAWAEKLARARTLQHSSKSERNNAGENLAMFTGRFDSAGQEATNMWYEEVKDYNFRRGGWQGGTGHFTQVVWKGTKELGMARAKTSDGGSTYVVGRYRPAGNVINFMGDNVFPRGGR
ncbi:PREDICTED: uncharacterized protein LOC107338757 [Acropora digitifera]|uniref:uncharacterized protein LOC107338757 n=1 Tax=Acropora digitifera TaxID=70779 RepID=UPI00077A3209|nr:PREDICTED: uncharacterized protein LOC107338757 [Acropora digitifera]